MATVNEKMTALANAVRTIDANTKPLGLDSMITILERPLFLRRIIESGAAYNRAGIEVQESDWYGITEIKTSQFEDTAFFNTVSFPNTLTSIGSDAFRNCQGLNIVNLPNSLETIGGAAFRNCQDLKDIDLPSSITSIGSTAFMESGLEHISLRCSVGGDSFYNCPNLVEVEIYDGTKLIDAAAFSNCQKLKDIYIWNKVDFVQLGSTLALDNTAITNGSGLIHVPESQLSQYKNATNWAYYANKIVGIGGR